MLKQHTKRFWEPFVLLARSYFTMQQFPCQHTTRGKRGHTYPGCALWGERGKKHEQASYWCKLGNKESGRSGLPSYLFWLKGRKQASPGENPTCMFLSHSTDCSCREANMTWPCIQWDREQTGRGRRRNGVNSAWWEWKKSLDRFVLSLQTAG